mmetsp:Transcript_26010/g.39821  ORF Transcript_26010/g.39821 Transcript_26010/m.39821 type:complete len:241 (-) Transcript_26010:738-1460(-)
MLDLDHYLNSFFGEDPGDDLDAPLLFSEYFNWKPQKMVKVVDLCKQMDIPNPDMWQLAFFKSTYFHRINFINLENKNGYDYTLENLFVSWPPLFVKPGRNQYIVRDNRSYFKIQDICDLRQEKLPPDFIFMEEQKRRFRVMKGDIRMRADLLFERSIKTDLTSQYGECMEADFSSWRVIEKADLIFKKDSELNIDIIRSQLRLCKLVLIQNKEWVIKTFQTLAAQSEYPFASRKVVKEWI